ncbi:class II histone deacetylase [Dactylosporangium sp. NPDC051484]|uniref:class II histone deacetylase n=1 Tax=Dactylosporangium sp. NPDC051484 TaxID=3154942 RepID=UPI00344F7D49
MVETGVAWTPTFALLRASRRAPFPVPDFLPDEGWDRGDRVQCLFDILTHAAGMLPSVRIIEDFPPATAREVLTFHTERFTRDRGLLGPGTPSPDVQVGLLAAGAAVELCRRIWRGELRNGYALVRPAGHHTEADSAGGAQFANLVLAAMEAKRLGARRILIVDWDAHHGNSQQAAFWDDPGVLTISIHQGRAYPPGTGGTDARGGGSGVGTNINVPVPMGSGGGVYRAVFDRIVGPAAARFRPDIVFVASGLDGSYLDPSARLALHSGDYGWMTTRIVEIAERYARGRLVLTHEGGYALQFMPLCLLRIVEALAGEDAGIADPFLQRWSTDFAEQVTSEAEAVIAECAGLVAGVPRAPG